MSLNRTNKSGIILSTSPKKSRSLVDTSGLPSSPFNLSASVPGASRIDLSWSAPTIVGDTSITGYVVYVTPSAGSVSYSGTSASVTGLSEGTSYSFAVAATNTVGTGAPSDSVSATTLEFNAATGGSVTTVSNYNGTGETWRVHQFTSSGTLNVTKNSAPFSIMVLNNGSGGGGFPWGGSSGGAGGPGGLSRLHTGATLSTGNVSVTVGGTSSVGGYTASGGTQGSGGGSSSTGGAGPQYNIVGSNTRYGGGGGGGSLNASGAPGGEGGGGTGYLNGSPGTNGLGGGGGGQGYWQPSNEFFGPGGGGTGRVIIAYQIG